MNCPSCDNQLQVIETRKFPDYTYRRLQCRGCAERFTSQETLKMRRHTVLTLEDRMEQIERRLDAIVPRGTESIEDVAETMESR